MHLIESSQPRCRTLNPIVLGPCHFLPSLSWLKSVKASTLQPFVFVPTWRCCCYMLHSYTRIGRVLSAWLFTRVECKDTIMPGCLAVFVLFRSSLAFEILNLTSDSKHRVADLTKSKSAPKLFLKRSDSSPKFLTTCFLGFRLLTYTADSRSFLPTIPFKS